MADTNEREKIQNPDHVRSCAHPSGDTSVREALKKQTTTQIFATHNT